MTYFLLALGFVLLIFGARYLIAGAASIGKQTGLSQLVIGLTVVAIGTSLPELIINVFASLEGNTGLAIGNVLGSNMMNSLFIVGIAAMISPIRMASRKCRTDVLFSLLATLVLLALANDAFFGKGENEIDKVDGFILLGFMLGFLYYSFFLEKEETGSVADRIRIYPVWKSLLFMVGGAAGLYFGGSWIVDGASKLAADLGVGDTFVGLTLVAVSTSLPELVTSILAARNNNTALALGNAVGSNVFNVFLVLGASAAITPIPFEAGLNVELILLALSGVLLIAFVKKDYGKEKMAISRLEGGILIFLYLIFFVFLFFKPQIVAAIY